MMLANEIAFELWRTSHPRAWAVISLVVGQLERLHFCQEKQKKANKK